MIRVERVALGRFEPGAQLAAHRHANAYAALVMEGEYEEASLDGRYACGRGDIVIHPAFHAHADTFGSRAGLVLNIPLPDAAADGAGFRLRRGADVEALAALAVRRPDEAGEAVLEECATADPLAPPPWLTVFLGAVLAGRSIAGAARASGVSPEHAARQCRAWFGLSPTLMRREDRIRRALAALRAGAAPGEAAQIAGFADQPHLTRILKAATGLTPGRLRGG